VREFLYIVDGHGYIFRALYGLMNASRGERKERIGRSMRLFGAANAAWAWRELNRLTEGVQGV